MNTSRIRHGEASISGDPYHNDRANTRTDHNVSNSVHGHRNQNVGNVSNSYNHTINVGVNEGSSRIHAWLSPLEPHRRHRDVSNRRLDGVGEWVLQKNEFESWCTGQDGLVNPTLLCYGGQGVGKTYISSLVIDTLCDRARDQNIAVLYLYCDYQAQKEQSAVNMIGGLLRQLSLGGIGIPGEIQTAFEESRKGGGKGLRLPDMMKLFVKTISALERVYICVDAVDELLPQDRPEFLRALRQILQRAPNARLFLTGRPYIREELDKHFMKEAYVIQIVVDQTDIARYLSRKMDDDDDRDPDLMTENLKNDIMNTMLDKTSEMFLLVALNIDAILSETSIAGRMEMLQKVATTGVGLDNVYDETLRRIKEQKGDRSRLGMEILMWVSHSERPLRIEELCHALAVKIGTTDLDRHNIRPQETILRSCLGLVMVDKETSTVRLIHYTLKEYLSRPGVLPGAHKTLGETCLTYLNYELVKGLPANNISEPGDMPFLGYSSLYWGSHAKMELSDRAKTLALRLLNRYDNHISSTLLFGELCGYYSSPVALNLFSGLHYASYFGIVEILDVLMEVKGCDVNQGDCRGLTPLMWAALRGNERAVRLLLTRDDVNPEKPENDGGTPLCGASRNGHEGVVRLLLARDDVNPNTPDNDLQTPLWWASYNGHEGIVRLLLARGDVGPDRPDNLGRTPLWGASRNGHEGVVRLLLARGDVNPDKPANSGRTPLLGASFGGHEGVVRLLLARDDVNPDTSDNGLQTPLWWASYSGHEGIVRLLLARGDVNFDKPEIRGKTPLWGASFNGNEGVVRLLLARDGVNPDTPDKNDQTPLWWASYNGHEGVVRLLLARGDVNPDKPDYIGITPLSGASRNGREGVARLLLARDDVNPGTPNNNGQTPLWCASYNGHEGVVRLLLARGGASPDKPDNDGKTPLSSASRNGHEGVVRILLTLDDVNPDRPDNDGRTPLWLTSCNGHEGVARLLLARDVSPDKPDNTGKTPLSGASRNGREGVVRLLLARDDVNPERPDNDGRTPLWWASSNRREGVARLLRTHEMMSIRTS